MAGLVRFLFEGAEHSWPLHQFAALAPELRDSLATDAILLMPDGSAMVEPTQHRMRERIRGVGEAIRGRVSDHDEQRERLDLIPGLQSVGTVPLLIGQPKVGKSTLAIDYAASLQVEGRRFLDWFEPAVRSSDARYEGDPRRKSGLRVTIVNVQNPPAAFEDEMWRALGDGGAFPHVYHLSAIGGPREFDLTEPSVYRQWADVLTSCQYCDGTDFLSPSVLILEDMTAVLSAAGKGPELYDLLYSRLRDLMREVETPSGLVTAHSTFRGDHALGGTESMIGPDGVWRYLERAKGRRVFSTKPRMGDPEVNEAPVIRGDDGRLRFVPSKTASSTIASPTRAEARPFAELVMDFIIEHGAGPSQRELRAGVAGNNSAIDAAVEALVLEGKLSQRPRAGRGGGFAYWPAG